MRRLLLVFGTRPEVIKLAPVLFEARRRATDFEVVTLATGQHREMLQQALSAFGIEPSLNLDLMRANQPLAQLAAEALGGVARVLEKASPDWVVVQGDTTTTLAASLAAFYARVPVAHVEAGLRTRDLESPFPEEANRQLVGRLAKVHLAPTELAKRNLLAEGIPEDTIVVTGNTVVDAIEWIRRKWTAGGPAPLPRELGVLPPDLILVTCHRREHFGERLQAICSALKQLARRHPDRTLVFPVHLNPNVREPVHAALAGLPNVRLIPPVDYETTLALLERAALVLTDSGGIQEEAPSFGVPAVVMRDHTERMEGIELGFATLAGADPAAITRAAEAYLADRAVKARLRSRSNPYGDGNAARRILEALG